MTWSLKPRLKQPSPLLEHRTSRFQKVALETGSLR